MILMCLSIPGKIVGIQGNFASVDYGEQGMRTNINISLVDSQVGSYVLVQGGFAIKVLSERDAKEMLDALKIVANSFGSSEGMF